MLELGDLYNELNFLRHQAGKLLADPVAAQALADQTIIEAAKLSSAFDYSIQLRWWLTRILLKTHKANQKIMEAREEQESVPEAPRPASPPTMLDHWKALPRLPLLERRAVLETRFVRRPLKDISSRLGLSEQALNTLLSDLNPRYDRLLASIQTNPGDYKPLGLNVTRNRRDLEHWKKYIPRDDASQKLLYMASLALFNYEFEAFVMVRLARPQTRVTASAYALSRNTDEYYILSIIKRAGHKLHQLAVQFSPDIVNHPAIVPCKTGAPIRANVKKTAIDPQASWPDLQIVTVTLEMMKKRLEHQHAFIFAAHQMYRPENRMTVHELADYLGYTPDTVSDSLQKSRTALAERFQKLYPGCDLHPLFKLRYTIDPRANQTYPDLSSQVADTAEAKTRFDLSRLLLDPYKHYVYAATQLLAEPRSTREIAEELDTTREAISRQVSKIKPDINLAYDLECKLTQDYRLIKAATQPTPGLR